MFTSRLKSALADNLAQAILALQTEEDCYKLFDDLFTIREIQDLSQRLEVARDLAEGASYQKTMDKTGASSATIGRVKRCLDYGEGGYRLVLARLEEKE
jgi:TrpR-related protein YerC/YecD